ncbi:MAG: DUF2474 domain-containing protein [Alphaproteobacteria bacterium]|nr:DUF2474 domain-containing protein [Alphaproteobacteria bacterium]
MRRKLVWFVAIWAASVVVAVAVAAVLRGVLLL